MKARTIMQRISGTRFPTASACATPSLFRRHTLHALAAHVCFPRSMVPHLPLRPATRSRRILRRAFASGTLLLALFGVVREVFDLASDATALASATVAVGSTVTAVPTDDGVSAVTESGAYPWTDVPCDCACGCYCPCGQTTSTPAYSVVLPAVPLSASMPLFVERDLADGGSRAAFRPPSLIHRA